MTRSLEASLDYLLDGVRDGQAALLMDGDGVLVAASGAQSLLAESIAGEYGVILSEATAFCEARGWGALGTFTVQGGALRVAFAPAGNGLTVGLAGGPDALVAQMRRIAGGATFDYRSV